MATNELRDMAQPDNTPSANNKDAKTRTIMVRFEIQDNDLIEYKLYNSLQCQSFKDFTKLPDTQELYDTDSKFRELCKQEKIARQAKNDYIVKIKNQ